MNGMYKGKHLTRKSASIQLRAMLMGLAVMVSGAVSAEGSFLLSPSINDLKEGNVMLAPVGRRGAGVRMSMDAPDQNQGVVSAMSNNGMWKIIDNDSAVHVSFVIPW